MPYETKKFDALLGLEGFSQKLLETHFTLYQGYVTNANKLSDILGAMAREGKMATPEFAELKRRFGWEWNGMRLHEYYFKNMTKTPAAPDAASPLGKKIAEDFGSFDAWQKEFTASGAMRGIGWVILAYDGCAKKLTNIWVNEHDAGHLAGATIVLVMDVFEHAFILDYGLKRADYIAAFFKAIDWKAVSERFAKKS